MSRQLESDRPEEVKMVGMLDQRRLPPPLLARDRASSVAIFMTELLRQVPVTLPNHVYVRPFHRRYGDLC